MYYKLDLHRYTDCTEPGAQTRWSVLKVSFDGGDGLKV